MRKYNELSPALKEEAKELHPNDYRDWEYKVQGVEIIWSAK